MVALNKISANLFLPVPLFFIIHNLEEALTINEWSQKIPAFIHPGITNVQFRIAVAFLSVLGIVVTIILLP